MSKYIKLYPTKANATSDANAVAPHVSFCEEINQMIYMPGATDTPIEIIEEDGKLVPHIKGGGRSLS